LDPAADRRTRKRFPIKEEVSYRILDHRLTTPQSGVGKTVDISSGGILFASGEPIHSGKRVQVAVNWPAMLDGGCPLQFVAFGRIVRSEEGRAAMHIEQYEFRTRRTKAVSEALDQLQEAPLPYY